MGLNICETDDSSILFMLIYFSAGVFIILLIFRMYAGIFKITIIFNYCEIYVLLVIVPVISELRCIVLYYNMDLELC